jgi:hypothetical protein
MDQVFTLKLDAALVAPLLENLENLAQSWLETARILEPDHLDHGWENAPANAAEAQRLADLFAGLVGQIKTQLPRQ